MGYLAFGKYSEQNIVDNLKSFHFVWPVHSILSLLVAITSTSKFALASYPLTSGLIEMMIHNTYFSTSKNDSNIDNIGINMKIIDTDSINSIENLNSENSTSENVIRRFSPIIQTQNQNPSYSSLGTTSCDFDTENESKSDECSSYDNLTHKNISKNYHENGQKNINYISSETGVISEIKPTKSNDTNWIKSCFLHLQNQLCFMKRENSVKILIRTSVPIAALSLGTILPKFLQLMSIIGSIFGLLISLFIPLLCYRKLFKNQISKLENTVLIVFLIISVFLMITGLMASLTVDQ